MYKNYPCNPAMGEMCPPYEYMEAYSPEMDYMAPMEYEMYQPGPEAYMPEMGMEHWPHYPQMPCPPMHCPPMPCPPQYPDMTEQLCEAIYSKVCDIDEKIDAIYPKVMDMHEKIEDIHKHMQEHMHDDDKYCK